MLVLAACAKGPGAAPPNSAKAPALASRPSAAVATREILPASAHEVSMDLAVSRHHKPVLDLEPSELVVADDGTPVRLTSLRLENAKTGQEHPVTLVFEPMDPGATRAARRMAEKILGVVPENGYSVAVFDVNGRLRLLQPYTHSRNLIDAAVEDATPRWPKLATAGLSAAEKKLVATIHGDDLAVSSSDRANGKLILAALEQSQRLMEQRRSYPSLDSLQALVQTEQYRSGRKFIFYFTGGAALSSDARDILRSIVGLANRAGVAICVVNTNPFNPQTSAAMNAAMASSTLGEVGAGSGVSAAGSAAGAGAFSPGAIMNQVHSTDIAGFEFGDVSSYQSPLVAMASGTGGIYMQATGSGKRQLREIHDDLVAWYRATWESPATNYNGQFRPVEIHPLRRGLTIQARSGYFAVAATNLSGIQPFEMPLLSILAKPLLPADLSLQAGVLHLGELPDGNSAELVVQAPVSELKLHDDTSTHISSAHAAIVAVIKNGKGEVLQRFGEDFPLHEAPEMLREDPGRMITLERNFSAEPGVYTLETAVMDRLDNKAGAQRTTFTIEAAAKAPAVSDIALVQRIEPVEPTSQDFDPMQYNGGRIVAELGTELPAGTGSLSLFFLLHPGAAGQPTLRLQIYRNRELLAEAPIRLQKVSGVGGTIPCLVVLSGHVLPAGKYQVKALLNQDGHTAAGSGNFSVEGTIAESFAPNPKSVAVRTETMETADAAAVRDAANQGFVINSPVNPVPPPSKAAIQSMIAGARRRALAWSGTLENFLCMEITDHFVDEGGESEGNWTHKATLVERLSDIDHVESRTTLTMNGDNMSEGADVLKFFHSTGEFGAMFHIIFDPVARTAFTWKRMAFIDGQPVQVFAFRVERANSRLDLTDRDNQTRAVGFHGLLYLDPSTLSIRRVSVDADDIPDKLQIRACSMSVDYAWVAMENHDFLLPVRGAVSLQEARSRPVLNEFEFRDYRRYGSQVRLLTDAELKALKKK